VTAIRSLTHAARNIHFCTYAGDCPLRMGTLTASAGRRRRSSLTEPPLQIPYRAGARSLVAAPSAASRPVSLTSCKEFARARLAACARIKTERQLSCRPKPGSGPLLCRGGRLATLRRPGSRRCQRRSTPRPVCARLPWSWGKGRAIREHMHGRRTSPQNSP
jgi:hypothetical protein